LAQTGSIFNGGAFADKQQRLLSQRWVGRIKLRIQSGEYGEIIEIGLGAGASLIRADFNLYSDMIVYR
jgi:hypothetical protein